MIIQDWGLVEYEQANQRQLDVLEQVAEGKSDDVLVFCSHPSVVTLGRGAGPEDLIGWQGQVVESSRGGRATYHGPNQIVIYPIIDLRKENRSGLRPRDVHAYLRSLESAMVKALKTLGVEAEVRTTHTTSSDGSELSLTGVWVGSKKLASIGIAVRKWITYHGVALNVTRDSKAFTGIRACGFDNNVMTSMEELGAVILRDIIKQKLAASFKLSLS